MIIAAFLLRLLFGVGDGTSDVSDRDRLVAESDQGKITYAMIACRSIPAPAVDCHSLEQKSLNRRLQEMWIHAATNSYHVSLTAKEQADVERQASAMDAETRRAAQRFHALDLAALRILKGEPRVAVVADLATQGITEREVDEELALVRTVERAEKLASRDLVAEGQRAVRESLVRPLLLRHLARLVERRAAARHVLFRTAEESFWSDVAESAHTRIVDSAFVMPPKKGILTQ